MPPSWPLHILFHLFLVLFHLSEISLNISGKPSLNPWVEWEPSCRFPSGVSFPPLSTPPAQRALGSSFSLGSQAAHAPLGLRGAEELTRVQTSCGAPRRGRRARARSPLQSPFPTRPGPENIYGLQEGREEGGGTRPPGGRDTPRNRVPRPRTPSLRARPEPIRRRESPQRFPSTRDGWRQEGAWGGGRYGARPGYRGAAHELLPSEPGETRPTSQAENRHSQDRAKKGGADFRIPFLPTARSGIPGG